MMKTLRSLLVCIVMVSFTTLLKAQTAFITQWDTRLTSSTGAANSSNATIQFGTIGTNYTISYVEVGGSGYSGSFPNQTASYPTLTFPEPGVYTVSMTGLTGCNIDYLSGPYYYVKGLKAIQQWGTTHWTSLSGGFYNASNMDVTATDKPDLSGVTSLSSLFWGANSLVNSNGSISTWNTSTITQMGFLFRETYLFNQPLNSWDVSKVTNMTQIFARAYVFNQPLSSWVTSNVTDMSFAFFEAYKFNQPLNSWDVSNVTTMNHTFYDAEAFNQPLNSWNVSKVTDMGDMFHYALVFNQSLNSWDVSKVTDLSNMFDRASAFNQTLGTWNLNSATTLLNMLDNSALSCTNYSSTLQGWAANSNTPNSLSLGAASLKYGASAQTAHNTLTTTKSWTISGDSYDATCSGVLPVMYDTPLTATVKSQQVLLTWATATEVNNKGFALQRSSDAKSFTTLSFVPSTFSDGNGTNANYTYTDNTVNSGTYYYRLQQTDFDGNTTFSSVVSVNVQGNNTNGLLVYPNPAKDVINVKGLQIGSQVIIVSMDGKVLKSQTVTSGLTQQFDISGLPSGIYILRSTLNGYSVNTKFSIR